MRTSQGMHIASKVGLLGVLLPPAMAASQSVEDLIGLNESRPGAVPCVAFKVSTERRVVDEAGVVQDDVRSSAAVVACGAEARSDGESQVLSSRRGSVPSGRVTYFATADSVGEWYRDSMGMTEYVIGADGGANWSLLQLRDANIPRPDLSATHVAHFAIPGLFDKPTVPLREYVSTLTANGYSATVTTEAGSGESKLLLRHPSDVSQHAIEIRLSGSHHGITDALMRFPDGSTNRSVHVEYGEQPGFGQLPIEVTVRMFDQGRPEPRVVNTIRATDYRTPNAKEQAAVRLDDVVRSIEGDFSVVRKASLTDPGKTYWAVDGVLVKDTRSLMTAEETEQ